jgi:G3E family GTPase
MRINAVCGFLGSGKTTLMRHILREGARTEPTALIVNEFGEVGVDGAILAGKHVDLIEISAGCLCCTLKGSLVGALEELRDRRGVRRVLIEASGVAQPTELLDVLADPALGRTIEVGPLVTVVDTAKFAKLRRVLGGFYLGQVQRADVVILNKCDVATPEERDAARREVARLNPRARVATAERCQVELSMILDGNGAAPEPSALEQGLASPAPAASFVSLALPADFEADPVRVERFFGQLPPEIVRAKGFMRIGGDKRTVQYAAGQLEITPAGDRGTLAVVFISSGEIDRPGLRSAFEATRA